MAAAAPIYERQSDTWRHPRADRRLLDDPRIRGRSVRRAEDFGGWRVTTVPVFPEGQIETLARLLGECGTGTDISRVLEDRGLVDNSRESTKWRRLYAVFLTSQKRYNS